MPERNLAEWLTLLEARHPTEIDLGLSRVAAVWSSIEQRRRQQGNAISLPTAITVAGTNGKGSCLTSMQAIMLAHDYRVGTFTSPHFLHYNERICVQGQPADDWVIVAAFEEIELLRGDISLTYFEFGTLAALLVFVDAELDFMLLEVGLGGRLDAINIIDADVAVVTSIALDHQAWLGDTRELIAVEKLGIARPSRPLVIAEVDGPEGFDKMIAATAAQPFVIGKDFCLQIDADHFSLTVQTPDGESQCFQQLPTSGLLPSNKAAAIQALICAGVKLDNHKLIGALDKLGLTGRQQVLQVNGRRVILDVAHNPAAASVLAASLTPIAGRYTAVASVLDDKDWRGIIQPLRGIIAEWRIAEIGDSDRATKAQTLHEVLYNEGLKGALFASLEEAFDNAIAEAGEDDTVVVFGSFHTVTAVLNMQRQRDGCVI
ncbi:bifunctional folylpolyglutamate synthase/dihydrofolate synthase [Porticoccaceae bacterium]|jgi:dihydrofolate synthase/folylpolyglutamate synthase|nr:bifunctional folylpolyglutamate synthase/dihydrofolate synthase [Porticoccaceae bacterium]